MDYSDHVYGKRRLKAKLCEPELLCGCFSLYVAVLPHEITIRLCQTVCFLCNDKINWAKEFQK